MKEFVLAIAAGTCAISSHAGIPGPMDFNVQLMGEVPSQGIFEVTPIRWKSGDEIELKIPAGWNLRDAVSMAEISWQVKSTYGAVRVRFVTDQGVSDGYGRMVNVSSNESSGVGYYPHFHTHSNGLKVNGSALPVATRKQAALGHRVTAKIMVGGLNNTDGAVRGHSYTATTTAIFETISN
ncbi:hypothetical protein [Ralstonia mojiangensis]|uniref:hypothetical protein n=1 Tax=Ralstonia mojiangensis TaxID=2953895 RepID=UPI0021B422BC|nr:hypothetical protein [Ralstonia mojiangensis]MCT7328863.1 hypothetical protein [Ralstonia mojiangensis]